MSQNEISSAYFAYTQSALLTNVSSYKCVTCDEIVDESVVFITADMKHDSYMVKAATDRLEKHLKEKGVPVEKHIIYSDGCSAQFKSKVPFLNLLDKHTEIFYFGIQHGKSQCDALGGFVKKAASRQVAASQGIISSAEDLMKFCSQELSQEISCESGKHKGRSFFLLTDVERPTNQPSLKVITNTRGIHSIKSIGRGEVETRSLSCHCSACTEGVGLCDNIVYTGGWKKSVLYQEETSEDSKGQKSQSVAKEPASDKVNKEKHQTPKRKKLKIVRNVKVEEEITTSDEEFVINQKKPSKIRNVDSDRDEGHRSHAEFKTNGPQASSGAITRQSKGLKISRVSTND